MGWQQYSTAFACLQKIFIFVSKTVPKITLHFPIGIGASYGSGSLPGDESSEKIFLRLSKQFRYLLSVLL
jgi:hypothetical protein